MTTASLNLKWLCAYFKASCQLQLAQPVIAGEFDEPCIGRLCQRWDVREALKATEADRMKEATATATSRAINTQRTMSA